MNLLKISENKQKSGQLQNGWPVLTQYDQEHLRKIALPFGGIGTGTVSLGGRGELKDWEIMNRPAKGYNGVSNELNHLAPFFAIYTKTAEGETSTRLLEGQIGPDDYDGFWGCRVSNAGLPRFRTCHFETAYPFGQVLLSDVKMPIDVRLEAFNPLIPGNADLSGIPVVIMRYVISNKTAQAVTASISGNLQNFIGADGKYGIPNNNVNEFRRSEAEVPIQGVFMHSKGVDPNSEQWGTIGVSTLEQDNVSFRTSWANLSWGDSLLDFWDDFSSDGVVEEREHAAAMNAPMCSLAASVEIPPHGSRAVTFMITWHFPNRGNWDKGYDFKNEPIRVGNYYTTKYKDAWDVAQSTAGKLQFLEETTLQFVKSFCNSDLPHPIKEAALFNLSTLRSQTCFRTEDGRFFGWEGCKNDIGCCPGSATHVWNYEQAVAFLFGDLACSMREVENLHAMTNQGLINIRVNLPLIQAAEYGLAAADGQMGCLMKLYRDWQLSGNDEMLRLLWPKARKALEFAWISGGWDADQDGVMEGCQHTIDVEFYGPNPLAGVWYLGALRAMEEMANYLGEVDFAKLCHRLFTNGSQWMDVHLFNGEYYEQEIRPISDASAIAIGLRHHGMGSTNLLEPDLQLGAGCLIDQLVGQYMANICGLGYLLDPKHVQTTLQSILKYNYKADLSDHFNHLRTFALNDEAGVVMCTYPLGRRPARPFPYYNEFMNGFEYTVAVHMLYEGQIEAGVNIFAAVRNRYDGRKRNPFNEPECGYHYARSMASWAGTLAISGFQYSAINKKISFNSTPQASQFFWSNGYAWGTFSQQLDDDSVKVELSVIYGEVKIEKIELNGVGELTFKEPHLITQGSFVSGTLLKKIKNK
jgi:non-lysosomal glucosylceramidase